MENQTEEDQRRNQTFELVELGLQYYAEFISTPIEERDGLTLSEAITQYLLEQCPSYNIDLKMNAMFKIGLILASLNHHNTIMTYDEERCRQCFQFHSEEEDHIWVVTDAIRAKQNLKKQMDAFHLLRRDEPLVEVSFVMTLLIKEVIRAKTKHPKSYNSYHEAKAYLDEVWAEIKQQVPDEKKIKTEFLHCATIILRTLTEVSL